MYEKFVEEVAAHQAASRRADAISDATLKFYTQKKMVLLEVVKLMDNDFLKAMENCDLRPSQLEFIANTYNVSCNTKFSIITKFQWYFGEADSLLILQHCDRVMSQIIQFCAQKQLMILPRLKNDPSKGVIKTDFVDRIVKM
jgi:hypothetical protein